VLEVVCAFFAVLELTKARRITVYQNRLFGDIRIRARPSAPPPEAEPAPAEETTRHES
jgi:chromatin segregation and condensation protein Rec8/ScpA/Scc1 (kleisin family)